MFNKLQFTHVYYYRTLNDFMFIKVIIGGFIMIYTLDEIKEKTIPIAVKYGVSRMSLFGSYARGEATDESDVDLLINKGEIKGLIDFVDFIHDLEQSLKCNVDVVTTSSHNKKFLEKISKDEVLIYGK